MKRTVKTVFLCLLFGAACTITVTWAIAFSEHCALSGGTVTRGYMARGNDFSHWFVIHERRRGCEIITSRWLDDSCETFVLYVSTPEIPAEDMMNSWTRLADARRVDGLTGENCVRIAGYGWPMRSGIAGTRWLIPCPFGANGSVLVEEYGIRITHRDKVLKMNDHTKMLPMRPDAKGFTINTFFYAAIVWMAFTGFRMARQIRRRRHGRCESCGYPIGASDVCSECGARVRARG